MFVSTTGVESNKAHEGTEASPAERSLTTAQESNQLFVSEGGFLPIDQSDVGKIALLHDSVLVDRTK